MSTTSDADVIVVGGGPAGLAAATALRARGVMKVIVIEREQQAGGIPRHCAHPPWGMREFGSLMRGPTYARAIVTRAQAAGVEVRSGITVVSLEPRATVRIAGPDGMHLWSARRIVLATGAREMSRAARLISGDRPLGVLNTGGLQNLVHLQRLRPFARPLIVGTELVSLSALMTCRNAGIRPVAMLEESTQATVRWPLRLYPRLMGVPVLLGTKLVEIVGAPQVEHVVVRGPDGTRSIECDGVLLTGRFTPESALPRCSHLVLDPRSGGPLVDQYGRCSDPGYYAAGNLLRPIETGGWCYREGWRIGESVADDLAGLLKTPARAVSIVAKGQVTYTVPGRLSLPHLDGAGAVIQIRVSKVTKGVLRAVADGKVIARKRLSTGPERRVLLRINLNTLSQECCRVEIGFE